MSNQKTSEIQEVAIHNFGNISVTEKIMQWKGAKWRYTVSGNGGTCDACKLP
jgi:hypothetical protein